MGDQDRERFHEELEAQVANYLDAARAGRRSEWIVQNFGPSYPGNITDAEVISDILVSVEASHILSITECETCGRLHVQREPGRNEYRSFVPDELGYHRVLALKSGDVVSEGGL